MNLPENKRREISNITKRKIWFYGAPFSGKTYLANQFPEPLMLNTDGNIKFIDAPYISIKDIVTVEGRITKRKYAWEILKDTITELEKKQNTFKTVVIDLIEDCYEYCRLFMYEQLGISHESDDSFRAWDKVRIEFLSTIKRLMNLDYENIILISHEDTSKDLMKRSGDKITSIKPNLQDKAALKIAGMVDLVARIISEEDTRTINFKTSEVIFGGGRLSVNVNEIPCDYDELIKLYDEANVKTTSNKNSRSIKQEKRVSEDEKNNDENIEEMSEDKSLKRSGRIRKKNENNQAIEEKGNTIEEDPTKKTRTRKTRTLSSEELPL